MTQGESVPFGAVASFPERTAALLAALPEGQRPTAGRLWLLSAYLPLRTTVSLGTQELIALAQVSALVEKEVEAEAPDVPEVDRLHALALIQLWSDRSAAAVELLQRAAALAPHAAAIRNDLAVALLARAREQSNPFDLARGLDAAEQAAELAPQSSTVAFNLALLLSEVGLVETAREQWRRCLALLTLAADARWQSEAEERLDRLGAASYAESWGAVQRALALAVARGDSAAVRHGVQEHAQPAREWGEEVLLAEWADAELAGEPDQARRSLYLAHALGVAVGEHSGDTMLQEATRVILRAGAVRRAGVRRQLAQGHHAFGVGLAAYRRHDVATALTSFSTAATALAAGGSPFRHWANFFRAACLYHLSRYDESAAAFAGVRKLTAGSHYLSLRGRLHWSEGLVQYVGGAAPSAEAEYERGLRIFRTAGEHENAAVLAALIAEVYYDYYGLTERAWSHLYPALELQSRCLDPRKRGIILVEAAASAADAGLPRTAAHFMSTAIAASHEPVEEATARLRRADYWTRAGRRDLADDDLTEVQELLERITDADVRRLVEADLRLAEGTVTAVSTPRVALSALSSAVSLFSSTHGRLGLLRALIERGELLRRLGKAADARKDLSQAVQLVADLQQQTPVQALRHDFVDHRYRLIESLVSLELDAGDDATALTWADRFRGIGRDGLDNEPEAGSPQQRLASARRLLPTGTLALYFVLLPDRLVAWALTAETIRRVETVVSRAEVVDRVGRLTLYGADRRELDGLFELLFRPFVPELERADGLLIFPDRELNLVPFAALRDAAAGKFVVESQTVRLAPSLVGPAMPSAPSWRPRRVLAVGDPALDSTLAAQFPRLPESAREANAVAGLYRHADLLLATAATPSRVLAGASQADVVHLGAHAVPGGGPALGRLLLAADPRRATGGVLSAHDLLSVHWQHHPLVFLSACHGAAGSLSESAGPSSLANAFIAAGAGTVVASLWPVEDRAASALAIEFHRRLLTSGRPAAALQKAQIAMLRSTDATLADPRSWGALALIAPLESLGVAPAQR